MHLKSTVSVGLALAALVALSPALPATAAPAKPKTTQKRTAPKASPKPAPKAAKPAAKAVSAVGKTPTETVAKLIKAMQRRDRTAISSAFNWKRFADEMNKLLPGEQGLDEGTYKTLLVETLDVEPAVSNNLRVGQETRKGADTATVEMRRVFPASGGSSATQVRTINILSLAKEKDGWRIYRLDSAQPAVAAPAPVPHAPQGMVPLAGSGGK